MQRFRIHHSKQASLRFTGTLDFQHMWERSVRRAGLQLAYTQGFNPTPRIQLAAPLALGFSSNCELADIWLKESTHPADVLRRLMTAFPSGISIQTVEELPLQGKSLPSLVQSVEYEIYALEPINEIPVLSEKISQFLAQDIILHNRRGKEYNLRSLVHGIQSSIFPGEHMHTPDEAGKDHEVVKMWMHLSATEGATGRPDSVLEVLGLDPFAFEICRTAIHINNF